MDSFLESAKLGEQFRSWAKTTDGISCSDADWAATVPYLLPQLNALVARYSKLGDNAFYKYYLPVDNTVEEALKGL